jgi:hypothetical protein
MADYYTIDPTAPVTTNDIKDLHIRTIYGGGHKNLFLLLYGKKEEVQVPSAFW